MMAEYASAYVYPDGESETVLFMLPCPGRAMREGDEFVFTPASGPAVRYKVETVEYRVEQMEGGTMTEPLTLWKSPEVYYGVSVVS